MMNLPSPSFLPLFFFLFILTAAQSSDPPAAHICNPNSKPLTSPKNIDTLLANLVSSTAQSGFSISTSGRGTDQLYGLAQCRGDVGPNDCSACIRTAANEIRKLCPNQSDARIWYDYCFLRYDDVKFFGEVDVSGVYLINTQNATDADVFNRKLAGLMDRISKEAVRPSSKGLGKGKTDISQFVRLYALVQCTRDLSELSCAQCLATAIGNFPTVCSNKRGCQVLYSSCFVRYEVYPFFFPLDSVQGKTP